MPSLRSRQTAATLLAAMLVLLGVPLTHATTAGAAETADPVTVSDASLAWSLNDQSNARSHNPAAINFLAAGVADPGRGGAILPEAKWAAQSGQVSIQKADAQGTWQTATWAGLGTDAHGASIGMDGPFSGHRVLLSGGTGTIDAATDAASLTWTGTFSVVYYGGNSIFTVTNPVLELAGGAGSLTAELGGWDSDRSDPRVWTPATPQRVSIADLSGVDVTDAGLTAQPAYQGVAATGSVPQYTDQEGWGAFPAAMVGFLQPLGIDQFWYSTGLSTDHTKVPAPLSIGYAGQAPVEPTPTATTQAPTPGQPSPTASGKPTRKPTPSNPIKQPPKKPTPTRSPEPAPSVAPPATQPAAAPAPAPMPAAPAPAPAPVVIDPGPAVQPIALTSAASTEATEVAPVSLGAEAGWWVGAALLLAAAVLLVVPLRRRPH